MQFVVERFQTDPEIVGGLHLVASVAIETFENRTIFNISKGQRPVGSRYLFRHHSHAVALGQILDL